jgi:hypothetical protein
MHHLFFCLNIFSWYDILLCRMKFVDNVKLKGKSMIGILDPTRVNQASHTVNLEDAIKDVQGHDNDGVQERSFSYE